jgi:hypothetical protein
MCNIILQLDKTQCGLNLGPCVLYISFINKMDILHYWANFLINSISHLLQRFNFSTTDLDDLFGGPAFLAWSRMNNLHG